MSGDSRTDFNTQDPNPGSFEGETTPLFTLLRYDARGNGLSDWDVDEVSLDAWVSDLETVAERDVVIHAAAEIPRRSPRSDAAVHVGVPEPLRRAGRAVTMSACRMLRAAKAMDLMGNAEARVWVSAVKAMVPERVCQIVDQAIQIHGATGVSQWTPLADLYTSLRTLRLADGPDEVHHMVVARNMLKNYKNRAPWS